MIHRLKLLVLSIIILCLPSLAHAAKTHRVKKNETIRTLAKKYHVSVDELKAANNLVGDNIKPKQLLVIPPRTVAAVGAVTASGTVYKVKKSETLSRVSQKTGVPVAELKRRNRTERGLKLFRYPQNYVSQKTAGLIEVPVCYDLKGGAK